MKKSFTLIETIGAITIISFVLVVLLQIKENNIFFLQKVEESTKKDMDIALLIGLSDFNFTKESKKVYLKDLITVKDDDIRKNLKDISFDSNIKEKDAIEIDNDILPIKFSIFEQKYQLKDGTSKKLYNFGLE